MVKKSEVLRLSNSIRPLYLSASRQTLNTKLFYNFYEKSGTREKCNRKIELERKLCVPPIGKYILPSENEKKKIFPLLMAKIKK